MHPAPLQPLGAAPTERPGVSVADAARRIGVAPSTLRTWERRYGLRPSGRTPGGHRRYTAADLAALQRLRQLVDSGLPTASAAALAAGVGPPVDPPREDEPAGPLGRVDPTQLFNRAVAALDGPAAAAAAVTIIERVGVVAAWTDVFTPHLQAAGEHWNSTGLGVEREHLGASAIRAALSRHTLRSAASAGRPRLLAAATPSEAHVLPLDALAAAVADDGVDAVVLEMLPAAALHAAVEDMRPAVLVLWARAAEARDDALLRSLVNRVPFVCAAGPGWERRSLPRSVGHLTDLRGAVTAVRAWTA